MQTDKIILVDNCDRNYKDLITFKQNYSIEEIKKVIKEAEEKIGYDEYTEDDILEALGDNFEIKEIYDLYNTYEIEF